MVGDCSALPRLGLLEPTKSQARTGRRPARDDDYTGCTTLALPDYRDSTVVVAADAGPVTDGGERASFDVKLNCPVSVIKVG
jgi:hypothetical protein